MKKVIISPFSRPLRNGKKNAKDYPFWDQVIGGLKQLGVFTIQVGSRGEKEIGCDQTVLGLPLKDLAQVVNLCDTWASVDNFFHHFCDSLGKSGVVRIRQVGPEHFRSRQ
jgi:hypothetical protein